MEAQNDGADIDNIAAFRTNLGLGTAATANIGVPNGVAGLDATGHVPTTQIPAPALGAGVTGVLSVVNGGTGSSVAPADGQILIGTGTSFALSTLTAGAGVSITNAAGDITISSTVSGGTVTNVAASGGTTGLTFAGSPITSSGTLTLGGTLAVASGGTGATTSTGTGSVVLSTSPVLTTPNLGTPSAATLSNATGLPLTTGVTGVLPVANGGTGVSLSTAPTDGQILIGNGAGFALSTMTAGAGVSITNAAGAITIASTASGGTVTSVAASGGTTGLTFTGSPITSSGTLTLGGTLAVASGGTGATTSTGTGSVVLSTSPVLTTPNLGTPSAATLTNATGLPLTTGVTGVLPVGNGGTGITNTAYVAVNAVINGGGSTITTGTKLYAQIPFSGTIVDWSLILSSSTGAAVTDSITVDVYGGAFSTTTLPATSIVGASGISVASATAATGSASGWTTPTVTANEVLGFAVKTAPTSAQNCTIMLQIQRT